MVFLCSCGGLIWENRVHVCGQIRCSCGAIKFNGRGHCCGYTPDYSAPPTNWELYSGYRSFDEWMGSTTWGKRSPSLFNTKNQEKCILNTASSMEDIKNLKQTGSFQDYCKSFDFLLTKVILSEEYATTLFVEGLNSDIGGWVKCLRPKSLEEAYKKAKNQVNFLAICDYYKNRKNAGDQILGNNETQFDDVVLEENGNDVLEEKGNDNKIVVMSESVNSESGIQEVVGSDELEIQKEVVNSGTDKVSADVKNDQESLDSDDLKKVKKECDSECAPKMFDEMLENVGGKINDGRVDNSKEYKKDNRLDEVHIDLGIDLCDDQYGGIVLNQIMNQEAIVWKLKIISGKISIKDRNLECLVFSISSTVYEPEKILCVEEFEFNNQFQVLMVTGHLWHKWKSKQRWLKKSRNELLMLNLVKQEEGGGLRVPILNVYKDVTFDLVVSFGYLDLGVKSDENNDTTNINEGYSDAKGNDVQRQDEKMMLNSGIKGEAGCATLEHEQDVQPQARMVMDQKIKKGKDQLIRTKVYLSFAVPAGNTHLIKELRLRIQELERAMGEVSKDSDLSKRAFQRMRAMENSLGKAARV